MQEKIEKLRDDIFNLILNDLIVNRRKSYMYSCTTEHLSEYGIADFSENNYFENKEKEYKELKKDYMDIKKYLENKYEAI